MRYYTTDEVATLTNAGKQTAQYFARTKGVGYVGKGTGKTYIWTSDDIERFKQRNKAVGQTLGSGKKSAAILEYLKKHPEATGKEVAMATNADAGQVSRIRKKLRESGGF